MSNNKHHIVKASLGKRSYPIYIGNDLLKNAGTYFLKHVSDRTIIVITDKNVAKHHLQVLTTSLKKSSFNVYQIIIDVGEKQKSISTVEKIYTQLLQWNIGRSSTIVALGGGVVGDLAGFIAATYQRGIGFIQIATTLLAQVDSSVGGKVGINHPLAKNMIGAFYQPQFVLIDTKVLGTLPKRELICGLGEVVKYGIILDKKLFEFIEKNLDNILLKNYKVLSAIIQRCCELKAKIVSQDELETSVRAFLNFGHTIGHSLEQAGKYKALKHGEAIFYGMVAETHIAYQMEMVSSTIKERIEQLILRIPIPSLTTVQLKNIELVNTMKKDKKSKNGTIRMTLPFKIGKVSLPIPVNEKMIHRAIDYVKIYGA